MNTPLLLAFGTPATSHEMPLAELLAQGGWAMIPIYACSLVGIGVFVTKLLELRSNQGRDERWFDVAIDQLRQGDLDEAKRTCRGSSSALARVVSSIVHSLDERPEMARSEAQRTGSLELARMERGLPLLAFLAQIAPLLGLLGTVIGMVELFMGLQGAGQGNLEIGALAGGIWKALLTTAAGLSVAVPVLAAHAFLAGRIDATRLRMTDMVARTLYAAGVTPKEERE